MIELKKKTQLYAAFRRCISATKTDIGSKGRGERKMILQGYSIQRKAHVATLP